MGFDRGRRGSRGDKRGGFGDDGFDGGFGGGFERQGYGGGGAGGAGGGRYGGGGGGNYGGGGGGGYGGGGFGGGGGGRFGGGGGGGGGRGNPGIPVGTARGIVKFFNGQKGFGFIVRDDGGEDVFVHISAVEQAGLTGLAEGQPLEFTLMDRGGRVSAAELKIEGEPLPVPEGGSSDRGERGGGGGGGFERTVSDERVEGTVKFFNAMKGFGFIQRDDGQPDAFVHISAVERSGLHGLDEGQRVSFQLETDRRGKTAATNLNAL